MKYVRAVCCLIVAFAGVASISAQTAISISSEPAGARVFFQGKELGKTPLSVDTGIFPAGSAAVELSFYKEFFSTQTVALQRNADSSGLTIVMEPLNVLPFYNGRFPEGKKLEAQQLLSLSLPQLSILREEIYARHGRAITDQKIRARFLKTRWYKENPNYDDAMLTSLDHENLDLISDFLDVNDNDVALFKALLKGYRFNAADGKTSITFMDAKKLGWNFVPDKTDKPGDEYAFRQSEYIPYYIPDQAVLNWYVAGGTIYASSEGGQVFVFTVDLAAKRYKAFATIYNPANYYRQSDDQAKTGVYFQDFTEWGYDLTDGWNNYPSENAAKWQIQNNKKILPYYTGRFKGQEIMEFSDLSLSAPDYLTSLLTELRAKYGAPIADGEARAWFESTSWYAANPFYNDTWLSAQDRDNVVRLQAMLNRGAQAQKVADTVLSGTEIVNRDLIPVSIVKDGAETKSGNTSSFRMRKYTQNGTAAIEVSFAYGVTRNHNENTYKAVFSPTTGEQSSGSYIFEYKGAVYFTRVDVEDGMDVSYVPRVLKLNLDPVSLKPLSIVVDGIPY